MSENIIKYKVILIENEESSQHVIHELISHYPQFELVGVFSGAEEAVKFLNQNPVDFTFLSINLPDFNGYQLLYTADKPFPISYTVSNIMRISSILDYSVIDFLRKPVEAARFKEAIHRALEKIALQNCNQFQEKHCPLRINLPIGACGMPIDIDQILFIQSWGNYVKIYMEDETMIVSLSTQKVLEMLPSSQFMRVHRSYIVNKDRVLYCSPKELTMDCDTVEMNTVPVGISYRQSIREKLEIDN